MSIIVKGVVAAGAAVAGLEVWKHFHPQLQSLRHEGANGASVQVVVPVADTKVAPGKASAPLPPNNGTSATFVPPPPVPTPGKLGLEPMVITPTGAANLSVDSISDVQNALNTLGVAKPPLVADGKPGPLTAAAISAFQVSNGLPTTGIVDPALKAAIQSALTSLAGTQKHIGQSLPVQAAGQSAATPDSPIAKSIVQNGLHEVAALFSSIFHGDPATGTPPIAPTVVTTSATPTSATSTTLAAPVIASKPTDVSSTAAAKSAPGKEAIVKLQRALNVLGASPPLKESGEMTPETVAALKALQITYGLVADAVPGPKTVATIAVALDPTAQAAVLPSVPKAADHIATIAATVPDTTAPLLAAAATNLKATAAATPAPSDAQVHASTAAAQAATASSASSDGAAAPLAAASSALAAAAAAPALNPAALSEAANHLANASAACTGGECPSIAAAAGHVAAAAAAPDAGTAGDHLNAAATHLSNAAAGAPPPPAATAAGEFDNAGGSNPWSKSGFGWDARGWWAKRRFADWMFWRRRHHPAYAPPMPGSLAAQVERARVTVPQASPIPAMPVDAPDYARAVERPAYVPPVYGDIAMERGVYGSGAGGGFGTDYFKRPAIGTELGVMEKIGNFGAELFTGKPMFGAGELGSSMASFGWAQGKPPPPPGHPSTVAYFEARNRTLGRGGMDDRYDRRHYNRYGAQNPWAGQTPWGPVMANMPGAVPDGVAMPDPNAVNTYIDPNQGLDPAADAQVSSGDAEG